MQNKLYLLTSCVLMSTTVFAQQGFDSVEDVMTELMNYSGEQGQTVEKETPTAKAENVSSERPAESPARTEALTDTEKKPVATVKTVESPSSVPESAGSGVPVNEESKEVRDEDLAALVEQYAGEIDTDKLLKLIDQASQLNGNSRDEWQALADLIRKEPENADSWERLWTVLKSDQRWERLRTLFKAESRKRAVEKDAIKAVEVAWSTDLVLRSFPLVTGAGHRMKLGDATRAVDVETLFSQVDFPKGSSAIYQPETETIFVNNTRENLAVLETMLETMGVLKGFGYSDQVEIEAKFVEVSEGVLEELGFQWNFSDPTRVGDVDVDDGSGGLFSDALRGSTLPFEQKINIGDGTVSASGDWSTFRFVDTFNATAPSLALENQSGNPFEMMISALDQNSGADVLSAPRILTRSGEEATIQVGELHYFPEVYEGDAAQATMVNVSYEDFQEKLLGVELTVTPKINDDREIMLELNPRISELVGWQSYQLAPANSLYNHRQLDTGRVITHPPIVASLPILKKREIETQVTMADGSTIGMGGLINERIESYEDRVPVLGSIPLVGRLFRSEGERVEKRNLLMFVTARIIDPNGHVETSRSFE